MSYDFLSQELLTRFNDATHEFFPWSRPQVQSKSSWLSSQPPCHYYTHRYRKELVVLTTTVPLLHQWVQKGVGYPHNHCATSTPRVQFA